MSRDQEWKDNGVLENALKTYVAQNLKRIEILDFVRRDFPEYQWNFPTLARRLREFQIRYINYDTEIDQVQHAVEAELQGPGQLLGYRAMNHKLRTEYGIKVPRHLVHAVMEDLDPEGLESRSVKNKVKKKKIPLYQMDHGAHSPLMATINCVDLKNGINSSFSR